MTAHAALREATRDAHDRLDAHFSRYDLANPADYRDFLSAHAAAYISVEQALEEAGAERLVDDWPSHRRAGALIADLTDLGREEPEAVAAPSFDDDAAVLGGLYVLEGSRLGGAVLKRTVGDGLPKRFLAAPQASGRWRRFVARLDRSLDTDESQLRAQTAALATFACFEQAAMVRA